MIDWMQWKPIPNHYTGNAGLKRDKSQEIDYWASRHWVIPALYSADDWYANEAERLRERAPA